MRPDVDRRITDAALAIAVALVLAVVVAADPAGSRSIGGYLSAVAFGAAMLARRRFPRTLLVATVAAVFVHYILDLPPVGMVLPALGALFSAAEQRRQAWAVGSAAVLLAVAISFRLTGDDSDVLTGYSLVTEIALASAAIALGTAVRLGREARERSAEISRLTAAEARHAAASRMQRERLRIGRDLHDTIGHSLSVAALHAGVAAEETDPTRRREALDRVRSAAGSSLRELRRTVRFLRADEVPAIDALPGLARVDELVATARESGLEVRLDIAHPSAPPAVDAAAFRILQESLTNIMRHSDAHSVAISTTFDESFLVLRVVDDGASIAPVHEGFGIRGMRERASLLGGSLVARPAARGFVVEARIPFSSEEDS